MVQEACVCGAIIKSKISWKTNCRLVVRVGNRTTGRMGEGRGLIH